MGGRGLISSIVTRVVAFIEKCRDYMEDLEREDIAFIPPPVETFVGKSWGRALPSSGQARLASQLNLVCFPFKK